MAFPGTLHYLPQGIQSTLNLIAEFDQLFLVGFANLEYQHQEILNSLQRVFTGTPLEKPLTDACNAIQTNEFVERHFSTLAATRIVLQGSMFDSLQNQIRSVLERPEIEEPKVEFEARETPSHIKVWQESIRHWLMEIALVGYSRLDKTTLIPFMPTLEQIQGEPLLIRQAALLTGYFNELIRETPVNDSNSISLYRWVDLWTQAMVGALRTTTNPKPQIVSGSMQLLGMDLKKHTNLVSFTVYGLFNHEVRKGTKKDEEGRRLAKITQSAYKVDAIINDEIWYLFSNAVTLLEAFAEAKTLQLKNIPMLPSGDLIWQGKAQFGSKYDILETAANYFAPKAAIETCYVMPDTRHPVQIEEPVYLTNYKVTRKDGGIFLNWGDEGKLRVASERVSKFSELKDEKILASDEIFGLMRFDGENWAVQPLVVAVPKTIYTGQNAAAILKAKPKINSFSILQERASRLLRKK